MGEIYSGSKIRVLKDGSIVYETPEPIVLTVKTKCPEKYMLLDLETGEKYIGYRTNGNSSWQKIYQE